jgi:chromosomal replication initiation ATPase DnaA
MRALARRALGTPDATEVERALGELRQAVDDLRQSVDQVHLLAIDDTDARRIDDTRQQVDRLHAAVLEHADTLDRIAGRTPGRPVT